jgi:hypothetical protein
MLFTHLGRVIGILALLFGAFSIVLGVMIANDSMGPYEFAILRYGVKSSGQLIDRGIYTIVIGVAFGILTEISYALRALANARYPISNRSAVV